MSVWIDFLIYTVLILTVWIGVPALGSRFMLPLLADRNADWPAAHPEAAKALTANRWFLWSMAWGLVSLGVLTAFQFGLWPDALALSEADQWMALKDINSVLLITGLLGAAGWAAAFAVRVRNEVPLGEHRQATLEPRCIDDFVPRWVRIATYALIGVHLAVWVVVGALERSTIPGFWFRCAAPFVFSGLLFFITRAGVSRRPNALDRIVGPGYRREEVRLGFTLLINAQIMFGLRLFGEVAGPDAFDADRAMHLGLVVFVIALLLRFLLVRTAPEEGMHYSNAGRLRSGEQNPRYTIGSRARHQS